MEYNIKNRNQFASKWGFILACIGSAVGMGNIWLFPFRIGQFGGAAFLIPYCIFVALIGYTGLIEEMCFGRSMRTGPHGAFTKATDFKGSNIGNIIGFIPVIGSFGIAIGYTVVVAWIIRFTLGAIDYSMFKMQDSVEYFFAISGTYGSLVWHIIAIVLTFIIMIAGISSGIEKVNKVMMPAFFMLFIVLAVRVATLDGAIKGYEFLFKADFSKLADIKTWVFALGQAFFSLSLAGSGTVVYGSYLGDDVNAPDSAKYTAIFDTLAAILASLVIIPSVFAYDIEPSAGPPLMFITMPIIFKQMPLGYIFGIIFFVAVLFAGITSLINLYETPIELLEQKFKMKRKTAVFIVLSLGFILGIFLEDGNNLGIWMDIVSIYIIPLGALLAGIMFFWICPQDFVMSQINKAVVNKLGDGYYIMGRYVYCGVTLAVYILGIFYGGIG